MADPEFFYAIRRLDGPMFDEYGWMEIGHDGDWQVAIDDSESSDVEHDYQIVRMIVEPVDTRTFVLGHDLLEWQRLNGEGARLYAVPISKDPQ